jgi:hypothetical protein
MTVKDKTAVPTGARGRAHGDDAGIAAVVQKIKAELDTLNKSDAPAVGSHLALGQLLAELRGLATRTWIKQVKALGYDRRVASRYVSIGTYPLTEMGLRESHLRAMLPPDVMKLEWIVRLSAEQLKKLTAKIDVKKASRARVIREVKQILGLEATTRRPDLAKQIDRATEGLVSLVKRISTEETDAAQRHLFLGELAADLEEVQQTLQGLLVPAPRTPCGAGESLPQPVTQDSVGDSSAA